MSRAAACIAPEAEEVSALRAHVAVLLERQPPASAAALTLAADADAAAQRGGRARRSGGGRLGSGRRFAGVRRERHGSRGLELRRHSRGAKNNNMRTNTHTRSLSRPFSHPAQVVGDSGSGACVPWVRPGRGEVSSLDVAPFSHEVVAATTAGQLALLSLAQPGDQARPSCSALRACARVCARVCVC
jgi:hypothetical protein